MGPYLAVPKKEKDSYDESNTRVNIINTFINLFFMSKNLGSKLMIEIVEIWSHRHVGLEKYHGGFTYSNPRFGKWSCFLWSL